MTRVRAVLGAVILAFLATLIASAPGSAAAPVVRMRLAAAVTVTKRTICHADYGMQAGAAYVRDDWWNERVCITVAPRVAAFTVATNVTPKPSGVVAYPYLLLAGWAWGVHAPATSWPVRINSMGNPRVTYRTSGGNSGVYNRSFDLWLAPKALHTGHGTAEVMIWLSARGYEHSPVYTHPIRRVRIGGIRFDVDWWMSSHRLCVPAGCKTFTWPLIILARVHGKYPDRVVRMRLRPFIDQALATGLIPRSDYLLSLAAGAELQSGARGLSGTGSVTGTTLPTITEPGGSS